MRRVRILIAAIPALLFLLAPALSFGAECLICHGAMEGRMVNTKGVVVDVHIDSEKFFESKHGMLDCTDCHTTYSGGPHQEPASSVDADLADLVPFTEKKSKKDPVALAACSRCHPTVFEEYKGSVHGKNIFEKGMSDGPLCLDCHGTPHYIVEHSDEDSMVSHKNVPHTCGGCHEKKEIIEKYNLSEYVIEKYYESFHGKKYLLGHQKVPVCSDCHGAHNIVEVDAPDSPVSGEGKVNTCGKCHEGAGPKFAAAPAHKYFGKENPIVYYSEKLLILLLLGTFTFIVSHVLLEAYSEIRDYLLSKNKGGSHD